MPTEPAFVPGRLSPRGIEVLRRIIEALFRIFTRVEIRDVENVPVGSGCLLTPNHLSRFDPPLVFIALPGRKLAALVADSYRPNPFFYSVVSLVDVIWVHRGATSPSTIKAAVRALRGGHMLGISPEGTRSRTHALQTAKTGAAFLALSSGAPVVPVAITNTEKVGGALLRLRRIPVTVTFGKPFTLPPSPSGRPSEAHLEACTTEIMCRIAALLPPQYRGVYAEHPRLKELLADGV